MPGSSVAYLLNSLRDVVGAAHVLEDESVKASYEIDWTRRWKGTSTAVIRPGNTAEVAGCLVLCAEFGMPIVPQGGNTGLVGGSVPGQGNPVILSTTRLVGVSQFDRVSGQVQAGAGTTLAGLQDTLRESDWEVGVDLAARSSATLGGMVATNAGGIRVIRHGMMRRQVVGLEYVTATGRVVSAMRGFLKDNTGYDITGLLCGSEGTLGVVTRVKLQLVPVMAKRVVALLPVPDMGAAVALLTAARPRLAALDAAEYVSGSTLDLVCGHRGLPRPIADPAAGVVLIECAGQADPTDQLAAAVGDIEGAVVGVDNSTRERLWEYREAATESIAAAGLPHKLDVTLPLGRLAEFESALAVVVGEFDRQARIYLFGHIGDGGVHVNVVSGRPEDPSLDYAVLELVSTLGGSVSAEHGIGRAKVGALHLSRSASEIEAMRAVKSALDPAGILNPGVLFPPTDQGA